MSNVKKNAKAAAEQIIAKTSYRETIGAERIVLSVEQPQVIRALKSLGVTANAEKTDFVLPTGFTGDKLVDAVAAECELTEAISNYTDSAEVREKLIDKIEVCLSLTRFLLTEHKLLDLRKKLRQKMPKGTAKKAASLLTHSDMVSLSDETSIRGTRVLEIGKFTLSDFAMIGFESKGFDSLVIKLREKKAGEKKGRKGKEIAFDLLGL